VSRRVRGHATHGGHEFGSGRGWETTQVGRRTPSADDLEKRCHEPLVDDDQERRYLVDVRLVRSEPTGGGVPIEHVRPIYADADLERWSFRRLRARFDDGVQLVDGPMPRSIATDDPGRESPPPYQGLNESQLRDDHRAVLREAHGLDIPRPVADGGRPGAWRASVDGVRQLAGVGDRSPCPHGNPDCSGPYTDDELACADCFFDGVDSELIADGGEEIAPPMYCPECDTAVPEYYDPETESFRCPDCDALAYEDREEYIETLHGIARWQREHGYGFWWDADQIRSHTFDECPLDGCDGSLTYYSTGDAFCENCQSEFSHEVRSGHRHLLWLDGEVIARA
jgi:hypothetical protein